ncbi:MAG: FecCD family ABC transporter permease [Thiomonas sp.]
MKAQPWLAAALLFAALLSLLLGRYQPSPLEAALRLWQGLHGERSALWTVIVELRAPRVAAAIAIGAGLAASGAAYQALFRNPLASPEVLGGLAGAAFGAALGILLGSALWQVQLASFAFGLLAVGMTLLLARLVGQSGIVVLLLAGLITGAFFTALLSAAKYLADPYDKLPAITYWLMGTLSAVRPSTVWLSVPWMLAATALLAQLGHALNVLSMGDEEAATLGMPVRAVRLAVIALATLLGTLSVVLAGMIAWVGLLIPQIARLIWGADNRRVLPASALLGALYVLLLDDLARSALSVELPLGVLTALVGLPLFALVLRRVALGWSE